MKKLTGIKAALMALSCGLLFAGCASAKKSGEPVSVHPREYTFDLIDGTSNGVMDIVYNQYGPNYQGKCDFTTLVKKDKPQAGDTVYIKAKFTADVDMPVLFGCLVDPSQAANYWKQLEEYTTLATDIVAGEPVELDIPFTLTDSPVSDFTFMLQYDTVDQPQALINKPAKLTFERVCESTDTRSEVPSAPHVSVRDIDIGQYAALCQLNINHPWENGVEIMSVIENYRASPDVTAAYGDDLPVAGDVINVTWKGVADADISKMIIYVVDCSEQAAWWKELSDVSNAPVLIENVKKDEPFECSVSLPIIADAIAKVNLIIQYDVGAANPDGSTIIKVVR